MYLSLIHIYKAITKNFEVKLWNMCVPEDEAIHIVEFSDDVICWACGALPFYSPDTEKIEKLWNQDHHLNSCLLYTSRCV